MKKFIFCLFIFVLILFSCDQDEQIGLEIHPPSDRINVNVDTFLLTAYTLKDDSLLSSRGRYNIAGYLRDPIFGLTTSSFCSQLKITKSNIIFGEDAVPDSINLYLKLNNIYAKSRKNDVMTFNVYELGEPLYYDSTYYSNRPIKKGNLIGKITFNPSQIDSILIDSVKAAPTLKIPLSLNFAKKIIDASFEGKLVNNQTFQKHFYGIVVEPVVENNQGNLIVWDLTNILSNITLYYHTSSLSKVKEVFQMDATLQWYSYFEHDYTFASYNLLSQINGDTSLGKQILFLQPMAGTKVFIRFPDLKSEFKGKNVNINMAELIIPTSYDPTAKEFPIPNQLTLAKIVDSTGKTAYLEDYIFSESLFDGYYYNQKKYYRFRLPRYTQNLLLNKNENLGLYLRVAGAIINPNRVILKGSDNGMKLVITYSYVN
ncbi:MAG: DUF4270 family protein [Bacteroidales bacterium]|nr:DUF4270 family protein [Bacteroidales bacterium]MDI9576360.1 DUF4270 family protein [Bacteroidota bacterium]MDD3755119.1 DUF4270 family protein [Bacteroidales bacterium]MDY0400635.1 DUF4270 family protein [Bacteroidales bacterium]HHW59739.1 DUF4270 domain-containing protein [Bacteroidales bacterium]